MSASLLSSNNQVVFAGSRVNVQIIIPKEKNPFTKTEAGVKYLREIHVLVTDYNNPANSHPIVFEPATSSDKDAVFFPDIHDAIYALFDKDTRVPPTDKTSTGWKQKFIEFSVSYYASYLINSQYHKTDATSIITKAFALPGRLTEEELEMDLSPTYLSRKPTTGELVKEGQDYLIEYINGSTIVQQRYNITMEGENITKPAGSYTDPNFNNYKTLWFINSLGSMESVVARTLEEVKITVNKQTHRVSTVRDGVVVPDSISTLTERPYKQIEMSSGAVNQEWAEWWATEFMAATRYWLEDDKGVKHPCTIEPSKKTMTILDKTKADALHVDFTVTMTRRY